MKRLRNYLIMMLLMALIIDGAFSIRINAESKTVTNYDELMNALSYAPTVHLK